jgi:(p)ppGpp synthase/HD superfamily hydrolase
MRSHQTRFLSDLSDGLLAVATAWFVTALTMCLNWTMTNFRNMVERALAFATEAHGEIGQVRKYSGEPYINHPIEVMSIVKTASHYTDVMLAAALLHDTIEDTAVTRYAVEREFGSEVADMVTELTDQCIEGNRATRKAAEATRLGTISADAQTVKLADLISNSASIVEHDPGFAKVYLREKMQILEMMTAGDPVLHARAVAQVEAARKLVDLWK